MPGSVTLGGFVLGPVRIMIGAGILAPWPAVVARLLADGTPPALEAETVQRRVLPIVAALGAAVPAWRGVDPALGPAGGVAALVAWLTVALQNAAGADLADHAVARGLDGTIHAVAAHESGVVGRAAMMVAAHLAGAAADPAFRAPSPSLRTAIANVLDLGRRAHHDQHTRIVRDRAAARGIPAYPVVPDYAVLQLGQGARQHNFLRVMGSRSEHVGSVLCDKHRSHAVLERLGLPVARQHVVRSAEAACRAAREIGGPVVVKPSFGNGGVGVTVDLSDPAEIAAAYRLAEAARCGDVLVEAFVSGDDFRLLVVEGALVAAARRIPGHVVGNGRDTIAALVAALNRDPRRGADDHAPLVRLVLDAEADRLLARRGYGRDSVPGPGEVVFLRATANISTGGTSEDVTGRVHPEVRRMAELVARAFHLDIVGVDYLAADIALPPDEAGGVVNEVNANPGLRPHPPTVRERVVDSILDRYFGPGGDGRIPVALITGTSGKTTTARMLAAMLTANGTVTGTATSRGVAVGGRVLRRGDCAGGMAARMALFDPTTEAAVLEVARGGILRYGLPVDRADVVAVLNVGHDHLGQDGARTPEDLARVKAVLVPAARGAVVLNADDPHCVAMASLATAPIVWTSLAAENAILSAHLRAGGTAVRVAGLGAGRRIVRERAGRQEDVAGLAAIAATLGGAIEANLRNAVAAVALATGLGLPLSAIAAGLARAGAGFDDNPGRFNLLRAGPVRVLLDAASCREDVAALRAALLGLPPLRPLVLALTHAGNYPDDTVLAFAAALAGGFDRYVCYDWTERRGRPEGEIAALLAGALVSAGVPPDAVAVVPDEGEAVRAALSAAGAGGLAVLVMQDQPEPLRDVLRSAGVDGWAFAGVGDWCDGARRDPLASEGARS